MPRVLRLRRERGPLSKPISSTTATLLDTYFTEYWLASQYSGSGSWLGEKGVADLALPGGSANPTFCGYSTALNPFGAGVDYVALPGTAGNYISTPDTAALDIVGDVTMVAQVRLADYSNGTQSVMGKYTSVGNQRSYSCGFTAGGEMYITTSNDGATAVSNIGLTPCGVTDNTSSWFAWSLDVDNGAGGRTARFWKSADAVTWTLIETLTTGATTTIHSGSAVLEVGSIVGGTAGLYAGSVARAQVYSGVHDFSGTPSGGTLVADFNPNGGTFGTTETTLTGTGDSLTWTINRSASGRRAYAITRDAWWFGTDDYLSTADNVLFDFGASQDFTVAALFRQSQGAGSGFYPVITKRDVGTGTEGWSAFLANASETNQFGFTVETGDVATITADTSWNNPGQLQSHIFTRTAGATGTLDLYTDAVSVGGAGAVPGDLGNALVVSVGRSLNSGVGAVFYEGLIYGLGISRTGLTAAQVTTLDTELRSYA